MGKHSTSERFGPAVFLLVGALPGGLVFFSFQISEGGQGQFTGHEVDQLVTRHMNPGRKISRDHQGQFGAIPISHHSRRISFDIIRQTWYVVEVSLPKFLPEKSLRHGATVEQEE